MTKDQQDLAWACLPKEAREKMKKDIAHSFDDGFFKGWHAALTNYFGHRNLTSDTEPDEMLRCSRDFVMGRYKHITSSIAWNEGDERAFLAQISLLKELFGDKCLPDKPSVQGEPKFNVGQMVVVKKVGIIGNIKSYDSERNMYCVHFKSEDDERIFEYSDFELEPYTEPETKDTKLSTLETESRNLSQEIENCDNPEDNQLKDNMEEKELNLCELLRDYKGEKIYVLSHGYMTVMGGLIGTVELEGAGEYGETLNLVLNYDGTHIKGTEVIAFPSRAFYEKYPLDAYSAWMEWQASRKPKRWVPKDGVQYWFINDILNCVSTLFYEDEPEDKARVIAGNCFTTQESCESAAEAVRECLEKFHKDHTNP